MEGNLHEKIIQTCNTNSLSTIIIPEGENFEEDLTYIRL